MTRTPPATEERFVIHAETSKDGMGHVLAELTRMGLANVGYELITEVVTFRKNGARKAHEVTGNDFAREFIRDNASFVANDLVKHFEASGRTNGSAYKAIRNLLAEKLIRKLGPGNYQRADVKALPAPKGKRHTGPRQEISNKDIVLKRIKGRARFTMQELRDHFRKMRRNPHSVSPIISKLFHAKLITQLEDGTYACGKKKKIAKKIPVKLRKKRGASAAPASQEGTTNG